MRSCVLALGIGIAVAVPGSASGAITIGSDLGATADQAFFGCNPACTHAHATLPVSSQAPGGLLAPSDGVVVRWRIKRGPAFGGDPLGPVAIRITRPGDSATRIGVGTGPPVFPPVDETSTYQVRLPIQAGDALGIDCCGGDIDAALFAWSNTATASGWRWSLPPLIDGEPARTGVAAGGELLVNADIEPDADGDGYGDETQDGCTTDATAQGPCPTIPPTPPDDTDPETEITKAPANKSSKSKAKYKFTSDDPSATFECSLKGKGLDQAVKQFGDCDSPRKYKRLDEGKFKFRVRAVDAAGNVDPSPAKDKFKVTD